MTTTVIASMPKEYRAVIAMGMSIPSLEIPTRQARVSHFRGAIGAREHL
jgi:hypothetical protein